MKDYIELEQVKEFRDEYRQSVHGSSELYEQEKFFTQYKKEVETVLNRIHTALEEGRVIANEIYCLPFYEGFYPVLHPQAFFYVLRDDGYLYFSSRYTLVTLGLGYRMKNGKVEECL